MDIQIEKLRVEEVEEVFSLVQRVIEDSFVWEGFNDMGMTDVYDIELQIQKDRIEEYKKTGMPYFLVAKEDGKIVGTIAYMHPGKAVQMALDEQNKQSESVVEVIASYVDPALQRKGIGAQLLSKLLEELQKTAYVSYAVSTGYKKGMLFWQKQLGDADVVLKGYYGSIDCFVWIKQL